MTKFDRKIIIVALVSIVISIILISVISFKTDRSVPEPLPVSVEGQSIQRIGTMGYDVTAYKVTTDGMTFLVVVNGNKGGVAITPIQR